MARLPKDLPGSEPPSTSSHASGSSRGYPASVSTYTTQAPVTGLSSQRGPAQHRNRNTGNIRHTRDTSVPSVMLESSDLANIDLSQLQVESDSSDSDYRARRCTGHGSGHSRSTSNPFPSLFPQNKKSGVKGGMHSGPSDSTFSGGGEASTSGPKPGRRGALAAPDSHKPSFSTGPCITCGSLMRWICGAVAFRCGICLTVNDLIPTGDLVARAREAVAKPQAPAASPISIEQTKLIISQCLGSYLEAVLQDVNIDRTNCSQSKTLFGAEGTDRCPLESNTSVPGSETRAKPPLMSSHNRPIDMAARAPTQSLWSPSGSRSYCTVSRSVKNQHHPYTGAEERVLTVHSSPSPSSNSQRPDPGLLIASPISAKDFSEGLPSPPPPLEQSVHEDKRGEREAKRIFLPLEDYIVRQLVSADSLDSSFAITPRRERAVASQTELGHISEGRRPPKEKTAQAHSQRIFGSDASLTGDQAQIRAIKASHRQQHSEDKSKSSSGTGLTATARPIGIDWPSVNEWYSLILNSGAAWENIYNKLVDEGKLAPQPSFLLREIEYNILKGQQHAQRVLLKCIETVLKRPGRRIGEFGDFRFLIIALANPLLHASQSCFTGYLQDNVDGQVQALSTPMVPSRGTGPASGHHSVIIKRILGLISNCSDEWHNQIITCFAQYPEAQFVQTKDLVGGFLAYRLVRYNKKTDESRSSEIPDSLVPSVAEGASAASFHAALTRSSRSAEKHRRSTETKFVHGNDWQVKAAVRVLKLLFTANTSAEALHKTSRGSVAADNYRRARLRGRFIPTSDFYITLLDNCDLVSDFEAWEQQTSRFSFCQYPFLLSIWAKTRILEYEARRQMKSKARDAFFDSILTRRNLDQHLILNVRRECLVEDSLKGVSAAIGSGTDDIKKGLRIIFSGEEGIDAGGLRKEWFLLLVREVFNPDHGMFIYDDESHYCYFNPASFETTDQFFLVGVVMGLAIYNSTILDVALPPFAFKKLLLAAPTPVLATSARPSIEYTLADLAEYRPRLAKGLQHLLDYDGDVMSTFCLDFSITVERFGHTDTVPLCPRGESRPVTNSNRWEYVDLYVRYLLDTSVSRQFEPFKRGFFTVCGCNALGLFQPEEIELLVRGSDEDLDVASLRLAASYEDWPSSNPLEEEPTIMWFWEIFHEASPEDQRKLLIFITGSDRIPATGPASLSIRILYLGNDTGRFPTARTCFNILTLYRYTSKDILSLRLWGAVDGSEGFGLK